MSQAWRVARIHSFEQVPVGTTTGLLRVGAVTDVHASPGDRRPALVADDGRTVTRFAALPAPDDTGGTLRSAYSAPHEIVAPDTVFSLEFEDGLVLALPEPTQLASASASASASTSAPPPPAEPDFWSSFTGLLLDATYSRAEVQAAYELSLLGAPAAEDPHGDYVTADLAARLAEAIERADSATLELAAERDLNEELRGRLPAQSGDTTERQRTDDAARAPDDARLAELEIWSGELERRLAETTSALEEARVTARHDDADLQRLHGELAEARAELVLFQTPEIAAAAELPARALPGSARTHLSRSPSELAEVRRDAVREAHRRAERDLADAAS